MAVQQHDSRVRRQRWMHIVRQNTALAAGTVVLLGLAVGALVKPELFYDRFIWKYFWGPIVADAGSGTAVYNGVVAHKGYTLVNEIGYGLLLGYVFLLLVTVLRRYNVGEEPGFILAFVPLAVSGGLLRVVEDVAAQQPGLLMAPYRYLLISPVIYMVLFAVGLLTLLAGVYLQRYRIVDNYRTVVASAGTVFALGLAVFLVLTTGVVRLWMLPASIGIASGVLTVTYLAGTTLSPVKTVLTAEGIVILFAHLLDASSTALSIESLGYGEKHPVVDWFIMQTGNAYWFIPLKLAVIGGILYYMQADDALRNDDPLFYNFILLGILIVGLGPGVRNMTRALLGV